MKSGLERWVKLPHPFEVLLALRVVGPLRGILEAPGRPYRLHSNHRRTQRHLLQWTETAIYKGAGQRTR